MSLSWTGMEVEANFIGLSVVSAEFGLQQLSVARHEPGPEVASGATLEDWRILNFLLFNVMWSSISAQGTGIGHTVAICSE